MKHTATHLFHRIKGYVIAHKVISVVVLVVLVWGGSYTYRKITAGVTPITYTLGVVTKGTLVSSVSGTGQVSNSDQLDIKPKVSGDITSVRVAAGQTVKEGDIIATIDARDAVKNLNDAQTSLESAQLSLQKLEEPADSASLIQSQNSLNDAQQNSDKAAADLQQSYDSVFTKSANAYVDLAALITDLGDILYNQKHSPYFSDANIQTIAGPIGIQYRDQAGVQYDAAKRDYSSSYAVFLSTPRAAATTSIEALLNNTHDLVSTMTDAAKALNNAVNYVQSQTPASSRTTEMTRDQSTLNSDVSKIDSDLSALTSLQSTIIQDKNTFASANRNIAQSSASLQKVQQGTDNLDIRSAQITVEQRQNALVSAQETLAEYTIRAPFDGIVGVLNVKKADSVSSGTSLATLITAQQIADIPFNEVDIANVKIGNKATLTFDAISDLTMTGTVIGVDTIGTVSQGVVSYTVKISFDTSDDRVKPGMSVSAAVITSTKQDVLLVPSSAVKTSGGSSYVLVFDSLPASVITAGTYSTTATPRQMPVQVGSSNDTDTEIVSGLAEGDEIVTRSVNAGAASTATAARSTGSLFGGGGATRALGR